MPPNNPLKAEINPICHLLAFLESHNILHVRGVRVILQKFCSRFSSDAGPNILVLQTAFTFRNILLQKERPGFEKGKLSSSTRPHYLTLLSQRAQTGRRSSFEIRVWFTESHIFLIISFLIVVLFTQFIVDIK